MTPEELERLAHAGSELPALLPMEEQMLFLSLRSLYAQHRTGVLSIEQAVQEKQLILTAYTAAKAVFEDTRRLARLFPDTVRATELDRALFHKRKKAGASDAELLTIARRIICTATGDKTF